MKAYILSVIGAVFLLDMVAIIVPHGKTGKTITGIVKMCSVLIMLSPVAVLLLQGDYSFDNEISVYEVDYSFTDKFECMRIESFIADNYNILCEVKKEGDKIIIYAPTPDNAEDILKEIKKHFDADAEFEYET